MSSTKYQDLSRIAIIGGGPGGTAAAKYLLAENRFTSIDVYEQQSSPGGVWRYSNLTPNNGIAIPQTNPNPPAEEPMWLDKTPVFTSPMYDHLETNIPHTMMTYSTDPSLADNQLFPGREAVLRYLERYAEPVRYLFKFEMQVTSVISCSEYRQDEWLLRSTHLSTSETTEKTYDAVVIASGHYAVPHIPAISGVKEWNTAYPNRMSHSKHYRNPRPYTALKTLIIGASASGLDISTQIATVCAAPLLLSQRTPSELAAGLSQTDIRTVPEVAEFLPPSSGFERAVRFTDGRIEAGIEKVLFCSGYYHSYPFLSSLTPPLITTGERVEHLYQHIFYTPHPTLAFVGVPSKILPFRTCEAQAAVIARVWSRRLELPPKWMMDAWEAERIGMKGAGRKFHELAFPEDLDYVNELVDWAALADLNGEAKETLPGKWGESDYWVRKRFAGIKKAFVSKREGRQEVRRIEDLGYKIEERDGNENEQEGGKTRAVS